MISEATLGALAAAALFLILTALLRALPRGAPAPAPVPVSDTGMDDREQALERRAAGIDQRERELGKVLQDATKVSDATRKESAILEKRVTAVSARERALAKEAAQLARGERELAKREVAFEAQVAERQKVPEPEPEPEPEPPPVEEPEPAPEPLPSEPAPVGPVQVNARPGGWTIQALERLVAERGEQFPEHIEEWRYYVHFLREHSGVDGQLPASFDYLIEDTFSELL